jgi:hypothetical protein
MDINIKFTIKNAIYLVLPNFALILGGRALISIYSSLNFVIFRGYFQANNIMLSFVRVVSRNPCSVNAIL